MLRVLFLTLGLLFIFSLLARLLRGVRNLLAGGIKCGHCFSVNLASAKYCRRCGRELHRQSRVPEYTVED